MLIYSNPFYIEDNDQGFSLYERDAICSSCKKVVDRQIRYEGVGKAFAFSRNEKKEWEFCPYCGEKLYK